MTSANLKRARKLFDACAGACKENSLPLIALIAAELDAVYLQGRRDECRWWTDVDGTDIQAAFKRGLEEAAKVLHRAVHEHLGMDYDQKAYSWHDVEDALESASSKIRALSKEEK